MGAVSVQNIATILPHANPGVAVEIPVGCAKDLLGAFAFGNGGGSVGKVVPGPILVGQGQTVLIEEFFVVDSVVLVLVVLSSQQLLPTFLSCTLQ